MQQHRFRTGSDHRSPFFITQYDRDEGEDGVLEDDIRLDQLVAAEGAGLWYEYDFGDGWDHALGVEAVLDPPPAMVRCIGGRMACPPEDCGGLGGYEEMVEWVRSGYDEALLPDVFDGAAHGRDWLPADWHPDPSTSRRPTAPWRSRSPSRWRSRGDGGALRAARASLRSSAAGGAGSPASHGPTGVRVAEANRLTETYRVFLDLLGDGVR